MNCLVVCLMVSACGEDNEDKPPQDEVVVYPTCTVPGELVIEGELDGQPVNIRKATSGYIFVNSLNGEPGSLQLGASDPDYKVVARIEFERLLSRGGRASARGFVEFTAEGVVAGNCKEDGLPGRLAQSEDGETMNFLLRNLKAQPYCGGAARSGELRGCILQK